MELKQQEPKTGGKVDVYERNLDSGTITSIDIRGGWQEVFTVKMDNGSEIIEMLREGFVIPIF